MQRKIACCNCNQEAEIKVYQTVVDNILRWSISIYCPFCNSAIESDDIGFPPEDIRQAILAQEGEYQLFIEQLEFSKVHGVKIIKILRHILEISLAEASHILNILELFSEPILKGTRIEMNYIKQCLEYEEISAMVVKK